MKIGIPAEITQEEKRVAATPNTVERLRKQGFEVCVEHNAGNKAGFTNEAYIAAGAQVLSSVIELYGQSDIILKVKEPDLAEVAQMQPGSVLICYLRPAQNDVLLESLKNQRISAFAVDIIPRITRAQKMDVLSSMANIAGYRAVVESAFHFGRFLNGQITAAGKVEPAKVLVIGAGVAGLAAIGAANSLGAIVRAFDTRKEVAEQITSMGAQFLTVSINEDGATATGYSKEMSEEFIKAEMQLFLEQAKEVDIVITTAQIPGRQAPQLWLDYHVAAMKPGSVIVDLAAETGGNCQLTRNGEVYTTDNGVTILGKVSQLPKQASQLYGTNLCNLLDDLGKADQFKIDLQDPIVSQALVTHQGNINWPPAPLAVTQTSTHKKETPQVDKPKIEENKEALKAKKKLRSTLVSLIVVAALLLIVGQTAPKEFIQHFTVFVLSVFVGWQVIHNVSHALHTPLMAVTNAISGIIVIGGLLQTKNEIDDLLTLLSFAAILVATINIVGGFVVTHRMLKMFKK
ncbi:MAG: Re/Si-specific NAD(P)(+) transhydrogenase subunit alpha [Sphingomonadales bacterium]|nr:Re/Si-specific NAD(P)(+) transhydrogenase subunit alpha [Sphingomonadales bacterium]